jgi:hypothetical protein
VALNIHYAAAEGILAWLRAFITIPYSRPPLLMWLAHATIPLKGILGSSERALLLTNIIATGVTLWLIASLVRRFGGGLAEILAGMLACGGTCSFVTFAHQFLVENVQVMAMAGTAWIAFQADRLPTLRLLSGMAIWPSLAVLAPQGACPSSAQKNALQLHRRKYWVIPKASGAFVAAMEDVLSIYTRPRDPDRPVVCLDEIRFDRIAPLD